MNESPRGAQEKPDGKISVAIWTSIAVGIALFIKFAVTDPASDNLLLGILLYLVIGLAGVILFLATFWLSGILVGREKVMRGDRVTILGYSVAAFSFIVAVGAADAAIEVLLHLM